MKFFLRILLIAATLLVSLESMEAFAKNGQADACAGNTHESCMTQSSSCDESPSQKQDPCSSHTDCSQCHMGHCCFIAGHLVAISMPALVVTKTLKTLKAPQDIYLPGFTRPPIA